MTSLIQADSPKVPNSRSCPSGAIEGDMSSEKHVAFIGNLPTNATKSSVQRYLSRFEGVKHLSFPTDAKTGRHKGYAKAFFYTEKHLNFIVSCPHHQILGVTVAIQKWVPRRLFNPKKEGPSPKKVFFRMKDEFGYEELVQFFSEFGRIDDLEIKVDRDTFVKRNFGFVNFESELSAQSVLLAGPEIVFNSKRLLVTPSKTNKQIGKEMRAKTLVTVVTDPKKHYNCANKNSFSTSAVAENSKSAKVNRPIGTSKPSLDFGSTCLTCRESHYADHRVPCEHFYYKARPALGKHLSVRPCSKFWDHSLVTLNHQRPENLLFRVTKFSSQ